MSTRTAVHEDDLPHKLTPQTEAALEAVMRRVHDKAQNLPWTLTELEEVATNAWFKVTGMEPGSGVAALLVQVALNIAAP